eukprot:4246914-Amphidinium_carterae.1
MEEVPGWPVLPVVAHATEAMLKKQLKLAQDAPAQFRLELLAVNLAGPVRLLFILMKLFNDELLKGDLARGEAAVAGEPAGVCHAP